MTFLDFLLKYWVLFLGGAAVMGFIIKYFFHLVYYCANMIREINKVKKIEIDLEIIKKDSSFIKGKVSTIEKLIKAGLSPLGAQPTPGLVQAKSPLSLTPKGEEILKGSGFAKIYLDNKDKFLEIAKEENPKLKYDAQENALGIMINLANDPMMVPIKKYAFKHGYSLNDVLRVAGVYLRDQIIKELELKE